MKKILCLGVFLAGNVWAEPLIVTTEDAPPYNYSTDGGKTITGSATDIVHELFKRAHVDYSIRMYPWERAFFMARDEKNTCVYSTTRTEAREHQFQWVGPVARNDWVLFALENSSISLKTLDEARKYRVGGYRGDAVAVYLEEQKFAMDNAANDEQTIKKLMAGRIDIWATGISAGPWFAKKFGAKIKPLLTLRATELHLACNLGVPSATIHTLNQTLKAMVKDGTTARIFQQYQ